MSIRSNNNRSTRVEDYYSDEEVHQNTPLSSYSNSPNHSPNYFKRNVRNRVVHPPPPPRRYFHPEEDPYAYSEEEEEDQEEELRRAIHSFGIEDYNNRLHPRSRSSFEYEMMYSPHHSPGYFLPPPPPPPSTRFDDYHHLMNNGGPPPMHHHPPPPPHWLPPHLPQNDMIMYSPQHQPMDLPFVRRSASSRSYNRRNRPNQRSIRRNPEALYLSHDEPEHDVNYNYRFHQRPSLSRQSSVGSNSSRNNNQFRKKRSNSFSAPGSNYPPFFIHPQHQQQQQQPHDFFDPRIHSEPNSPHLSPESSGEEEEEEYYNRRNSMPAVGDRRPLGRSLSFQGMPPHPQMVPPPPPLQPQQPPHIIMHPPPMPHPNVMDNTLRRNASMFNLPTNPPPPNNNNNNGAPGGEFLLDPNQQSQSQEHTNGSNTPASDAPPSLPMWMSMPPPPPPNMGGTFPNSPGNPFNQQQQQQQQQQQAAAAAAAQMMLAGNNPMNMFNNPLMPPPQQPMWNFMNPQDLFFGNEMPLPFMNSSDPNVIMNAMGSQIQPPQPPSNKSPAAEPNDDKDRKQEEMMPQPQPQQPLPNEMMMPPPPPPQEPMLRRTLSMLGGLFSGYGGGGGGGRKNAPPYFGGPPHPPPPPPHFGEEFGPRGGGFTNFRPPIQGGYQSKKEAKLAQQYQKLGLIWCWRIVNSDDNRFESFNLSNQKLIKRKEKKNDGIMLGKEKKLPGEIMIDLNRRCGCAMTIVNGQQTFTHIEIKQEPFEGSSIVFNGGGSWM